MRLNGCRFSADGRMAAIGCETNVVLLNVPEQRVVRKLPNWRIAAFTFDPWDEMLLAAATTGLHRWRIGSTQLLETGPVDDERVFRERGWRAISFSPEGDRFVAANIHSNAAYVFDRTLTNLVAALGPHPGVDRLAVAPGARWIATGSTTDRWLRVWNTASGMKEFEQAVGAAPDAAFSADGKWLAAFGGSFTLLETGSWRTFELPFPHGRPLAGATAFSPDNRLLAVVSDLFDVQLFDLEQWQPVALLRTPSQAQIYALAFSPDGTRLLATCEVARLRVWDLSRIRRGLNEIGLDWR